MCTYLIQEISVVADNNNCILEINKEFLEPCNSIHIQVVCRLIEQQYIRITEERFCKEHLDLDGVLKIAHCHIMIFCIHAKSVKECCSICLGIPAIHFSKLCFELCSLLSILICEVFLRIDSILFLHDIIESLITHDNSIKNSVLIVLKVILLQN